MAEAVSTVDVQWWYRGSTVGFNCGSRAFKVADRENYLKEILRSISHRIRALNVRDNSVRSLKRCMLCQYKRRIRGGFVHLAFSPWRNIENIRPEHTSMELASGSTWNSKKRLKRTTREQPTPQSCIRELQRYALKRTNGSLNVYSMMDQSIVGFSAPS
ncbi:hypothetical protein CPB83DRAFT_833872 [Crepidotus variabilis]|uniref:Uncharacterized protein n=1 Tax=Crepidotus variabilis TaxID=179855 RepID=A0A9P6EJG9_9AGAR|nr:hypothetical protein CPB83DRAFT_833872 [Crepidotus variabilis]